MHTPRPSPGVGRRLLGLALTLAIIAPIPVLAQELAYEGRIWVAGAVASSLLLLVAAWRNWPLLWNPLGVMLRSLLGERGARLAFAAVAVVFALSAAASMSSGPRICCALPGDAPPPSADSSAVPS
jgi:hypothetical protein